MCIIIAKEKDKRLPSIKELKNSFVFNSDGAGFMYIENGKVVIDKGYMNYTSFINHYEKLCKKFDNFENKSLIIHCRIGTHGKNNKGNTHPYPITNNERLLHTRKLSADIGIVHNGIIRNYGTDRLTDTQDFIANYVYPLYKNYPEFYKNEYIMEGIERITNSKLAILLPNEEVYYVGDFIDDLGLKFSNDTYLDRYSYYGNYALYDYSWYYDQKEKQDNQDSFAYNEILEDYLYPLQNNWFVEYKDEIEKVGEKNYFIDFETSELYQLVNNNYNLIANSAYVYDENFEEVF